VKKAAKKTKAVKTKVTESPASPPRRNFLYKIWLGLGGLVLVEVLWTLVSFLKPGRGGAAEGSGGDLVVAGPVERFPTKSVTAFQKGRFYLARLEDGGFLALFRECTHLGCTVPWSEEKNQFICPCHSSAYDITGEVVSPPAPRALDLFAVRIENGIVKIDTGTTISRRSFDAGQVTRP
jgi:cytochrome b6-f complex iron-sulfur subunit